MTTPTPTPPAGPGPRIKICGITRLEDARRALDLGAWALGFIFHRPSPRWIAPEAARAIVAALPEKTRTIGVFVDSRPDDIQDIVERVVLRGVQLHGDETPDELAAVQADLIIKAFRVGPGFDAGAADAYDADLVLLDTHREGLAGGTGASFDWSIARQVGARHDVIVAGGIGPANIVGALRVARPWAVDVSSGVEAAPGVKDARKLEDLFARAGARRGAPQPNSRR